MAAITVTKQGTALVKIPFAVVVILMLSVLSELTGCGGAPNSDAPKQLSVGYIPIAECAPLYVAQEQGFFEKQGLKVNLVSLQGGAPILSALDGGTLDVGFTNVVSLVLHRANGHNVSSFFGGTYETQNNQNHAIVLSANIPEGPPAEMLKGRKVAVNTYQNVEELNLRKYLATIKLPFTDLSVVEVPFPQMLPFIEAGSIEAASIVEPFITIAKNDKSSKYKILTNHYLATSSRTLVATYATSEKTSQAKSDELRRFALAMAEATNFLSSEEAKGREIIGHYTKIPPELLPRIGLPEFTEKIDQKDIEATLKDMESQGYLKNLKVLDASVLIQVP